jgi:hypothetical protein
MYSPPAEVGAVRPRGPSQKPHPADGLTADVNMGDGAFMTILDPRSFQDGGLGWRLAHWGDIAPLKHTAVSVIESYDYLLSEEITTAEAIRRLRLLRAGRSAVARHTP